MKAFTLQVILILCLVPGIALCGSGPTANPAPAAPPSPAEDGTMPALTAIAGQGMMNTRAYDELQDLSDNIGGRLTGSPQAAKAIEWGQERMRAIGLSNVHAEKWQLSHGWTRISANAELTAPIQRKLSVDSMGWVGSTPKGGAEGEVVPVNMYQLDQEMKDNAGKWGGKVLLMVEKGEKPSREDMMKLFGKFGPFLKAAFAAHAIGVIGGQGGSTAQGMHLTHTGSLGFDAYYDLPVVSMIAEDQEQLERFLDHGKTVRVKLDVQNRVSGPVESANVVGDIPGTEHPEQVVVIGGHLDSWDLAEGTTDDGVGVATTLGAAEAIIKSGQRPRRTMRFVLFTGEEQGLLGSLAYTKTHKDEMKNHVGAVILDNGQGPVVSLNLGGRDDLIAAVQKFTDSVKAFGEVKVDDRTVFGTDAGPFILAGLPGINMGQDSPEYKYTHHSAVDTFDKVRPDLLTRDSTLMALTAFWIADRPERLASPWSPQQTAAMLTKKHEDTILKMFGMWPFGDLGGSAAEKTKSGGN
ncbi:MAG TPA: M20/M25/M40 family metallo-hydrolase [Terriglobales bacterium]|nr:M20/M25/M40 family metallo-hydrolase [Terriglobales bacterium]